jgi:hypothetical protein
MGRGPDWFFSDAFLYRLVPTESLAGESSWSGWGYRDFENPADYTFLGRQTGREEGEK